MDFYRHMATGRTAEMFGEGQLEADIFLRTLGWERVAAREYQVLSPLMRGLLEAYARGVNAYLSERGEWELSLEYVFLGIQNPDYRPAPWKPSDTLAFAKVVAWDLRANIVSEIERAVLSESLPEERVSQIMAGVVRGSPGDRPRVGSTPAVAADHRCDPALPISSGSPRHPAKNASPLRRPGRLRSLRGQPGGDRAPGDARPDALSGSGRGPCRVGRPDGR